MKIVKLDAINSTNAFLKDMVRTSTVENYTVVVTENQTNGKGQFDNSWTSEKGKNLTFSILCEFQKLEVQYSFYLNCAISLAVYTVLNRYIKKKLKVKWPNDILSSNKKLCGILIENTVSNGKIVNAVIGVGLNVNQERFPVSLPRATSLKMVTSNTYNTARKGEPAMYKNDSYGNFLGKILGITYQGKLIVELENETLEKFDLKEIEFI